MHVCYKGIQFLLMSKKYFYLIGQNIKTSLSPLLHNTLFHLKGNSHYCYQLFREGTVPRLFQRAEAQQPMNQIDGLSITIPFKRWFYEQQSIKKNAANKNEENKTGIKIEYIGQFANKTKVINTLVKEANDVVRGYNTDIFGVEKCLRKIPKIENVLVLGAGATSTTFVHYLQYSSACNSITIHNRSAKPIQTLCREYKKVVSSKQLMTSLNSSAKQINVIINTLPSQVISQNVEIYKQLMKKMKFAEPCYIMDVNYRVQLGMLTDMLGLGRQQVMELKGCTGLDMLIWQAIQQNRLFCMQKEQNQEKQQNYYRILRQLIDSVPSLTR